MNESGEDRSSFLFGALCDGKSVIVLLAILFSRLLLGWVGGPAFEEGALPLAMPMLETESGEERTGALSALPQGMEGSV